MYKDHSVAVVVPAYNEESQIGMVIETMPDFVDRIIIVNDYSNDKTAEVVKSYIKSSKHKPIQLPTKIKEQTLYNKAEIVVEEMNKNEIDLFPKWEIFDAKDKQLVLVDLKENSGVGGAIASGYKWVRQYDRLWNGW